MFRTAMCCGILGTLWLLDLARGESIRLRASDSATVGQFGLYRLWGHGNYHEWWEEPLPQPYDDGYAYETWELMFDFSEIPEGSRIESAVLEASWTVDAPDFDAAIIDWPQSFRGAITQDIKYFRPEAAVWLNRIEVPNAPIYWFPARLVKRRPLLISSPWGWGHT